MMNTKKTFLLFSSNTELWCSYVLCCGAGAISRCGNAVVAPELTLTYVHDLKNCMIFGVFPFSFHNYNTSIYIV
jgi:hypothetical protein